MGGRTEGIKEEMREKSALNSCLAGRVLKPPHQDTVWEGLNGTEAIPGTVRQSRRGPAGLRERIEPWASVEVVQTREDSWQEDLQCDQHGKFQSASACHLSGYFF